jgi:capsule polysaccharide export protein KpsE/RkpR
VRFFLTTWILVAGVALACGAAEGLDADLAAARTRLAELRLTCKDRHPAVQAQLQRIGELEIQVKVSKVGDPELAKARLQLDELRKTCKEAHPAVQAQLKRIAELEKARK